MPQLIYMMKSLKIKKKIIATLIASLFLTQLNFAGSFFYDNGKKKYMDDNGKVATGWRWIDDNGDNIAECYRFGKDGVLASRSLIKGKETNKDGQWVVDGVVQKVYKSTMKPLYSHNAAFGEKDINTYIDLGTESQTKRINATNKDIKKMIEADLRKDEEDYLKSLVGPKGTFVPTDDGIVYGRGAKNKVTKRPVATKSQWYIIDDVFKEDDIVYLSASESIVAGRPMENFRTSENKCEVGMDNVKIYGGGIWNDVICLKGNGAYIKFQTSGETHSSRKVSTRSSARAAKDFKANYLTFEVAHQTHGESTADTYCGVELYLDGKSVAVYDEFCDDEPEIVEEWLDDGEKTVEFRAVVTGDAPGRKIYIRNARFRQIREKVDK